MFFEVFLSFLLYKFDFIDDASLSSHLKEQPNSVILFFSGDMSMFFDYFSIFDVLHEKFNNEYSIVCCEIHGNYKYLKDLPVSSNPEIIVFKNKEYLMTYYGEWTEDSIASFISRIVHENANNPLHLSSIREIMDFQEQSPVNLILFGEIQSHLAYRFKAFFDNLVNIPIAYAPNINSAIEMGITKNPIIQLNRPFDDVSIIFESFRKKELIKKIIPLIKPIYKHQIAGNSLKTRWTLLSLNNHANLSHRISIAKVMKHCSKVFGDLVNYQTCDFYDCFDYTNISGIKNNSSPVFLAIKQFQFKNLIDPIVYKGHVNSNEIRKWMRKLMTFSDQTDILAEKYNTMPIQYVAPNDFLEIIENPKTDTIILIGNPEKGSEYTKQLKLLYQVKNVFAESKNIQFFLLNSKNINLAELQIQHFPNLAILLFPATDKTIPVLIPSVFDFVKTVEHILFYIKSSLSKETQKQILKILPNIVFNTYL